MGDVYLMDKIKSYAAPMLVVGCVLFGLGSLIVKFVPVGGYAIAFWRLLIASFIFWFLMKLKRQRFPKSRKAMMYAALAGIFLAFDLSFWHESVYAVGPGISTLLNSLQIFFLGLYNLKTHKVEYFDKSHIDKDETLIKASCALLLLARPYEFKGEMWMDAGLVDMISIEQSLRAGNDKHIVISTKEEGYVRNPAPKWQLLLSNLVYKDKQITDDLRNRHIRYKEQWDKIAELEKQGKALVLRPHKDLGVTRYTTDPEKLGPWFQLGYDETLERMDQIKEFIK